ncbi:MAG: hypothetical protein RHS_1469 [Robinsoniella sp. RHS]|nr:MAG: hypothetical protein RHS_1469 [Robinsoniella sp. RHS]
MILRGTRSVWTLTERINEKKENKRKIKENKSKNKKESFCLNVIFSTQSD